MTTANKILHSSLVASGVFVFAWAVSMLSMPSTSRSAGLASLEALAWSGAVWTASFIFISYANTFHPWWFDGEWTEEEPPSSGMTAAIETAASKPEPAAAEEEATDRVEARMLVGHRVLEHESIIVKYDDQIAKQVALGNLPKVTGRKLHQHVGAERYSGDSNQAKLLLAALQEEGFVDGEGEWTDAGRRAYHLPTLEEGVENGSTTTTTTKNRPTTTTTTVSDAPPPVNRPIFANGGGELS